MVDIERYSVPSYSKEKKKSYIKQCLRYAQPSFSIFKKEMTRDEEYLLSEVLSLLGQFDGLPNLDALEGLRLGLGINKSERQIISFTKNPLEGSNLLGELFTAASQKQVVEIHYHKFPSPEQELVVNLHPYLLKEYNTRWYLFAAAEDDEKMLCFGLDRIDKVVPLPSHKYVEYNGDLNERFEDIIGVTLFEDSPLYEIIFWVSDFSKDYVSTKPIHESQRHISDEVAKKLLVRYPKLSGGKFFRIDCKYNYELIRELTQV
ncbi:MAG: WYL domain-containing protein [Alloprevotella sp.]|nr:WYL domain-containing protein [Alloprevotella sp.]